MRAHSLELHDSAAASFFVYRNERERKCCKMVKFHLIIDNTHIIQVNRGRRTRNRPYNVTDISEDQLTSTKLFVCNTHVDVILRNVSCVWA